MLSTDVWEVQVPCSPCSGCGLGGIGVQRQSLGAQGKSTELKSMVLGTEPAGRMQS